MNITDFIDARLTTEEVAARSSRAIEANPGPSPTIYMMNGQIALDLNGTFGGDAEGYQAWVDSLPLPPSSERTLRRCAALRAIVADEMIGTEYPTRPLRHIASIWSDHPDFDLEWSLL